jgi:uncharacterized RDD family membrane protein YckC
VAYCANCGAEELADQQFCANCGKATSGSFAKPGAMPYFPMDSAKIEGPPLAGYWWRVLAYLIDAIILGILINLPLRSANTNVYVAAVANIAFIFAYGTFFLTRLKGQTIGMMVARIRCVDAVTNEQVTLVQALRRNGLFCILDLVGSIYHYVKYAHPTHHQSLENGHHAVLALLLLIPVIIDVLWPLWDKRNQALHDKFANTVVLRPSRV